MKSYLHTLLGLVAGVLFAQTPPSGRLTGSWANENLQTDQLTQLIIRRDSAHTFVHAWGSCHPSDCDWGEAESELWNGITVVNWDHGFSTVRMQLVPQQDGRLLVGIVTEYRDGSGRKDKGSAEFFARETAKSEAADALRARELLHQSAEAYRNLTPSRFEATEIVHRASERSEIRSEVHSTVLFSPPNRWRRELTGGAETRIDIASGQIRWTVYPQSNEYVKTGQGAVARPFLYDLLDKGRSTPEIIRQERLGPAECTVVQIRLGRGVTQELWIDDRTHLIRKDITDEPGSAPGSATRRETTYTVAQTGERISEEAFTYMPEATHAVNRTEAANRATETLIGKPAPDITLRDLDGGTIRLRDLRGKAVLLDFWATWCAYCREALPTIELYHRGLQNKGLIVYGVDDESNETVRPYLLKYGYTMPSLWDEHREAVRRFRVEAWPTTVLIDRDGIVVYYGTGAENEKLRDAIRSVGAW
jgi:peroxiredoxin